MTRDVASGGSNATLAPPEPQRRSKRSKDRDGPRMPALATFLGVAGLAWTLVAVAVPLYAILAITFGRNDPILMIPRPGWNPVGWHSTQFIDVLKDTFGGGLGRVWLRTDRVRGPGDGGVRRDRLSRGVLPGTMRAEGSGVYLALVLTPL